MKTIIGLGICTLTILSSFISCKKGDHDPFLSLKSRKARLEGSWTVTNQQVTEIVVNGGTTTNTSSIYDGTKEISTVTTTIGNNATTTVDTIYYSYTLTMTKDGSYSQLIKSQDLSSLTQTDGRWIFLHKDKTDKLKNKEAILMTTTKTTILNTGATNVVEYTDLNGKTIVIDELKSKEMITIIEEDHHNDDGLSSTTKTTKTVFTQK